MDCDNPVCQCQVSSIDFDSFSNIFSRKKIQMPSGMYVSMITAQNWEDAYMHVTMRKHAKMNVWTSSKLVNSTAPVRYNVSFVFTSY